MATRDTRRTAFRGKVVELTIDQVELPNGHACEFEIIRHPGGAAAAAVDESARVCLLRQYRYAVDAWLWELPAGKRDHGEPPLETAQRELAEEAGVEAAQWTSLGQVVSSPGVFTEIVHVFLARELSQIPTTLDAGEVFELHWIDFGEALDWAHSGRITDGKTLVGLLRAERLLRAEGLLG